MNRRRFLGSILAACAAPAVVRAESLMRCSVVIVPTQAIDITTSLLDYGNIGPRTAEYVIKEMLQKSKPFLLMEQFGQVMQIPPPTRTIRFRRYTP